MFGFFERMKLLIEKSNVLNDVSSVTSSKRSQILIMIMAYGEFCPELSLSGSVHCSATPSFDYCKNRLTFPASL